MNFLLYAARIENTTLRITLFGAGINNTLRIRPGIASITTTKKIQA